MLEENIACMCAALHCYKDPMECEYSLDRYLRDHDCNGPFVSSDEEEHF